VSRVALALVLPLACAGCFSAQPSAESYHNQVLKDMSKDQVHAMLGTPKVAHPIPGQGDSPELPVEQWRYEWNYPTAKTLTIVATLGVGLIFMDLKPYGFDVAFGRDGRVRILSDVGPRPR
jgi:hypothetical protein